MGIKEDFAPRPVHAHLNLLGFVALFLFGLYYHAVPEAAASVLAKVHAWTAVVGAVVFPVGIAAALLGQPTLKFLVVAGAIIVFVAAALFAIVVFRYSTTHRA
jgi:cbb3-type cytochrome oxidase subunit 1